MYRTTCAAPSREWFPIILVCIAVAGCSGPREADDPAGSPDGGTAAASAEPAVAEGSENAGDADIGGRIYRKACYACHQSGLVGAPRLGDGAAWEPRIARGVAVLVEHALKGFQGDSGIMPPKGGHAYLSEDEVAAAVGHMVRAARRTAPVPGKR